MNPSNGRLVGSVVANGSFDGSREEDGMRRIGGVAMVIALAAALAACAHESGPKPETPQGRHVSTPPPATSPLAKVHVGMNPREVEAVLGPPNDENAYVTGKAFIPWYFGRDRTRRAYFYRGQGRVVFEGSGGFSQAWKVTRVDYDPNEMGRAR